MSAMITCDGCGVTVPMKPGVYGWDKPESWFQRVDLADGPMDACSRHCIRTISQRHERAAAATSSTIADLFRRDRRRA